jgi:chromosome partitioning protein
LVLAFAAGKGGVGKTTLTGLVAQAAARAGRKVLAVDADPQRSLSAWADMAEGLGDSVTVVGLATPRLDRELVRLAAGHEVVVIDCPPGLGDRAITEAALRAATLAVIPMGPSVLDVDRLRWTMDLAASTGTPSVVVLNKARAQTRRTREVLEALDEVDDVARLEVVVPFVERIGDAFGRQSAPPPAGELWQELEGLGKALAKRGRRARGK